MSSCHSNSSRERALVLRSERTSKTWSLLQSQAPEEDNLDLLGVGQTLATGSRNGGEGS